MLPENIADEAERLTRRARDASDAEEADSARRQRDEILARHGYIARERTADTTLVLYPSEWVTDGRVRIEQIETTDSAIERPLEAPGNTDWETVEAHNRTIVERVTAQHGDIHGKNAAAFADFMGNHYLKPIEEATETMREEFLKEYYPRNVWPSKKQRTIVEQSVELTLDIARE